MQHPASSFIPTARCFVLLASIFIPLAFVAASSTAPSPRVGVSAMPQALPAAVAVYVTVPDKDTGKKVATALIESKLAACVNMIPGVESMYWWQGKVETDQELLLMIKSRASLVDQISAKVQAVHPYDTPEVIAVPITEGSAPYMKWLIESTIAE
mmetsp:Transcript_34118/g.65176  ORF Transcript_34118/g.65176 Transcript_34118/m.65176 type:complete len:155 (-) Transcript_34118:101-565(-)